MELNRQREGEKMLELFGKRYLTEKEAAQRYNYSGSWFRNQRWKKLDPKFIKSVRKVYYPLEETDIFFKKKFGIA